MSLTAPMDYDRYLNPSWIQTLCSRSLDLEHRPSILKKILPYCNPHNNLKLNAKAVDYHYRLPQISIRTHTPLLFKMDLIQSKVLIPAVTTLISSDSKTMREAFFLRLSALMISIMISPIEKNYLIL